MKIKVFTLFSIVFILLGCRDYNSLQPTSISSVTDFMKFTSSVDFKNQIDKLKTLSPEQLKKWNDSTVILSILDMKNDNYSTGGRVSVDSSQLALYDEMLDPIFASILNKNGEFSVGDLFIRVTPDIVFMSTFDKIDKVRALDPFAFLNIQPNKTIIQDGIKIGRVYHERTSLAGGRTLFNGVDHTIYDWDDRHRSATVIYNDNWLIYKSIGCKVKFQNKRWWGGWWQDDTDALYMSYDVVYDISTLPTIVDLRHVSPPARSCTNCGLIDNYIDGSTLSIGIGESGFTADLIDSPFDFKYFIANSQVTWRGNVHSDDLREDQ